MSEKLKPWGFELEEYIHDGEPDKAARADAWQTAIGLQAVDGLKPSRYLIETAQEHIEGDITIDEVQQRIEGYYKEKDKRTQSELEAEEADIVSSRIAKILGEPTFSFSPATWTSIHARLFSGVIKKAGVYRDYNISKSEWVLKGDTVRYASWDTIGETIDYDFNQEKAFSYKGLSSQEIVAHITKFTSSIWQIHPFGEGNTRSTAVFIIKYLNSLGYKVNNQSFADNSWYFRNALVRANYNNLKEGVVADSQFLEAFFQNLLLGESNELKNRFMHLDWMGSGDFDETQGAQSAKSGNPKCKSCTLEELTILRQLGANPKMTQKELAEATGRSERTIKTRTVDLQERGLLARERGKRNGNWVVLVDLDKEDE